MSSASLWDDPKHETMFVRFGTYSIKIKSYRPTEIGLDSSFDQYLFQIHQKVFHIWYIPIFPVEKHGVIKEKSTGKITNRSTAEMRTALNLIVNRIGNPIWSYSGSFVLGIPFLVGLFFLLTSLFDLTTNEISNTIRKRDRIAQKEAFIENPQLDDLYTFKVLRLMAVKDINTSIVKYKRDPYYGTSRINYVVTYLSKDSIGFDLKKREGFEVYQSSFKKEIRLSKIDLERAISKYQELAIQAEVRKQTKDFKMLLGVFEIKRGAQEIASSINSL